jgi:hypothetical protein
MNTFTASVPTLLEDAVLATADSNLPLRHRKTINPVFGTGFIVGNKGLLFSETLFDETLFDETLFTEPVLLNHTYWTIPTEP